MTGNAQKVLSAIAANDVPWGSAFADKMLTATWHRATGWARPVMRPYSAIPLSPAASVFHYGLAVFDGLKAYKTGSSAAIFRPDLHLTRLNASAERVALPTLPETIQPALEHYVHAMRDWIPTTEASSLYLRIAIIGTEGRLGVRPSSSALLVVMASPVNSIFERAPTAHQDGVRLLADPRFYRASAGGLGACKAGANYAASMMPARDAVAKGFDQMLWLSDPVQRNVTEVGMMNIFFVYEVDGHKSLVTPRLDGTFLDGVTRRSILHLARDGGIDTQERDVPLSEVFRDVRAGTLVEIFGSGTAALVCPVYSIECEGDTVAVRKRECDGDLGLFFRRKLAAIQRLDDHPWMVKVDGTAKVDVGESDAPLSEADLAC